MERRKFSREFKLEAVKLVRDRGVTVVQAARDLDLHVNVLRKWVREQSADPQHAFPGHGQMKPEQLEIEKLRREVAKLKAERDILKKAAAYFARDSICGSPLLRSTEGSGWMPGPMCSTISSASTTRAADTRHWAI
jgi:transposase